MPRRRRGPDFMILPWWSTGGTPYWMGLHAFEHINSSGIADAQMPLVYRDKDYNTLREPVAAALNGYQVSGEFGITWHEDSAGKSWFVLNNHGLGDRLNLSTPYAYHLARLSLDGQTFERDHVFVVDVANIEPNDLTIPVPFVTDSGYHAAFAIAPNDQIALPTPAGVQYVDPDSGLLVGPPIAWPVVLTPFQNINGGIDHANWQLRGFHGSSGGILAQLWYSDVTVSFVDPGQVPHLTCVDVQWNWWFMPWENPVWSLVHHFEITDHTARPFSYWIPGGPFGGTPPGAPFSPWDFYYDIGGWHPSANAFHGVLSRAFTTDNMFERDYELTTAGMVLRPSDSAFRRRRPVRLIDGAYWTLAAPSQFAQHVIQKLSDPLAIVPSQTVTFPPILTSPMSPWRPGKGPAT